MPFPVEAVPDGAIMGPHHMTYLSLATLFVLFVVWDNFDKREPLYAAAATSAGLFGFLFVWPYYHTAGALLSLAGPVLTIASVSLGWLGTSIGDVWDDYPRRYRILTIVFSAGALDDPIEHAFGWTTPLDFIWNEFIYGNVKLAVGVGLVAIIVAAVVNAYLDKKQSSA